MNPTRHTLIILQYPRLIIDNQRVPERTALQPHRMCPTNIHIQVFNHGALYPRLGLDSEQGSITVWIPYR